MRGRAESPVPYEPVEHTADLGVELRGENLADLFARAAAVLADILFDATRVEARETRRLSVQAGDAEALLVRWLNELIVLRELEDFLWRSAEVEMDSDRSLTATLAGEPYDAARHVPKTALKAATYHQLRVEQVGEGFKARIIFDV